ncbi:hypothetical protein [Dyella sp.]|uniref:hypothetical protein n=1 Tax=Dyella sp. TaxID=1869338 RepID=UPI002D773063|nr:hypothetical protein [Dyella sp.]HET7332340.1 hypothetical protein [Dyella sp.]HET9835147.1 hypothetical protein [Rhodanobacteraceae bacterium]
MIQTIEIPHVHRRIGERGVTYTNLRCDVEGEPRTRRIVWLYVRDPELKGGDGLQLHYAESAEAVSAINDAILIDHWEVRFDWRGDQPEPEVAEHDETAPD